MNLSQADVLYGGAYRVCFERLDPDNCVSQDMLASIDKKIEKITVWAQTQSDEIKTQYVRALAEVRKRAETRAENVARGAAMVNSYKEIPKPPME